MLLVECEVRDSGINGAGKGLFLKESVEAGKVIAAPDNINKLLTLEEVLRLPENSTEVNSSICWFENRYSCTHVWSEECYLNHSFSPNCLWHLGFTFARYTLQAGTELCVDYSLLLGEGVESEFADNTTHTRFMGLSFSEVMRRNAAELMRIYQ